ncbi:hypothetical protein [Aquiluna sp. KACHI24]|uniref:hypothetical protein n=1 Tax=Aquiluna sp. KACHI24 TaxID=2968831 RepID=UPI00220A5239|nr:hypothetical protein [Aquiluna sp. KACHI24]BDQ00675.1 hypothetical protein AKACHI_10110 [Aquiluna sp. KACHI24]
MQIKKIATLTSLVLATALLSGCSLSREVTSLEMYAPSDGTMVDAESLKARNVMIIKGSGNKALLIGSFVNSGMEPVMASLQTTDSTGEEIRVAFEVKPSGKFDLGYNGTEGVLLSLDSKPGSLHTIYVSDGSDPIELVVPVMDGSLAEYRPFVESLN